MKPIYRFAILSVLLLLAGCKENLYSNLSEQDANVMVAILEQNGIASEKVKGENEKYSLQVEKAQHSLATTVLKDRGYPQKQFTQFDKVFPESSLVKTPQEQRARALYLKSQELSKSLTGLDGVVSAEVHIALPPEKRFGEQSGKPSASVLIHHRDTSSVSDITPKIKQFVAHAVNDLTYENVTVVMNSIAGNAHAQNQYVDPRWLGRKKDKNIIDAGDGKVSPKVKDKAPLEKVDAREEVFLGSLFSRTWLSWLLIFSGFVLATMSLYLWRKASKNAETQ